MPSKTVNDRRKLNRALRTALAAHLSGVLGGLEERLGPCLEDGSLEDGADLSVLATFQEALTRMLASREAEMVAADEAMCLQRYDQRAPIRRRNELVKTLRAKLLGLRKLLRGALGNAEGDELLALDGRLTEDPLRLHQQARVTLERLRDEDLPTPRLRVEGLKLDRAGFAAALEPLVEELGAVLDVVDRNRQLAISAQAAKTEAVARHDRDTQAVAGLLTHLLRLAGHTADAERLQPASRRRPRPEDVERLVSGIEATGPLRPKAPKGRQVESQLARPSRRDTSRRSERRLLRGLARPGGGRTKARYFILGRGCASREVAYRRCQSAHLILERRLTPHSTTRSPPPSPGSPGPP